MTNGKQAVAGIDEAGYGPILGPLVVGRADFQMSAEETWTGESTEASRRFIDDSKRLLLRGRGLARVESVLLHLLEVSSTRQPATLGEWLDLDRDTTRRAALHALRWYESGLDRPLPLFATSDERRALAEEIQAARFRWLPMFRGVELAILPETLFNSVVTRSGNKHDTLFELVAGLCESSWQETETLRVYVDKLGGRNFYLEPLDEWFPFCVLEATREDRRVSTYRIGKDRMNLEIGFYMKGDSRFLPIALASMAAKYTREALMLVYNAYWRGISPAISPTAGYWEDGLRFLQDLERSGGLSSEDRLKLVRTR